MPNILIIGATRGLGAALTQLYASKPSTTVYATTRSSMPPSSPSTPNIQWLTKVDVSQPDVGQSITTQLGQMIKTSQGNEKHVALTYISAGYFATESFDKPDWDKQLKMYTTSAIGPVFVVHHLQSAGYLKSAQSKIILITSESGSIALRHESEGGGNYGHHASKAAENMVGKLLSFDLRDKGVAVGMVHPGFIRTEMTKSVGFDKYWDKAGGAFSPTFSYWKILHRFL
jgi:NAD(P)-dependent dehydrogenase (short-subunit alcohol dehydrogenase family)